MKLIIASSNKGKIKEYSQLLSPFGFEAVSQKDEGIELSPEENGCTFEENAAIKARAIFDCVSGCAVLADDSGLVCDALGGEPGIYSARYGGLDSDKARTALLLEKMAYVPDGDRTARFVCVIHMILPDGREITARGECGGKIGYEPTGENGFGYDPVFMYGEKSFAQLSAEEKNSAIFAMARPIFPDE